jgi:uncharacterized BrkB/YihY/UPF0761 family membrane protein
MEFDKSNNAYYFFTVTIGSIIVALLSGSIIDTTVRKIQNDTTSDWTSRSRLKALLFFLLQTFINVFIFLCLVRCIKTFTKWLQLSISGALFAVVFFVSQRNWSENVNAITNF